MRVRACADSGRARGCAHLAGRARNLEQQLAQQLHAALPDAPALRADARLHGWQQQRQRGARVALHHDAAGAHGGLAHTLRLVGQAAQDAWQHGGQEGLECGAQRGGQETQQREVALPHCSARGAAAVRHGGQQRLHLRAAEHGQHLRQALRRARALHAGRVRLQRLLQPRHEVREVRVAHALQQRRQRLGGDGADLGDGVH